LKEKKIILIDGQLNVFVAEKILKLEENG